MLMDDNKCLDFFQVGLMILIKTWCVMKCVTKEMTIGLADKGLLDHFKLSECQYISSP